MAKKNGTLRRIAEALDRLSPPPPPPPDFAAESAFVWEPRRGIFRPIARVNAIPLALLRGLGGQRDRLLANTRQFARGHAANNALLWGARGTGKSSLVKAVNAEVAASPDGAGLKLVEIHREDIATLGDCLDPIADAPFRFLLFCDDLSFEQEDSGYKSLKALLEGGIAGRPGNVVFYATSNRRHLMPRNMAENEGGGAIHPGETVEEKVSLSDRFGLWIGFHAAGQDAYLDIVRSYAAHFGVEADPATLEAEALSWAHARGARSGRVAWQFIQDFAGRRGVSLNVDSDAGGADARGR
jgi:predicted AAA+ superfamily ATPase